MQQRGSHLNLCSSLHTLHELASQLHLMCYIFITRKSGPTSSITTLQPSDPVFYNKWMVHGLHLYSAFLVLNHSKHFTTPALPIHMHSYTGGRRTMQDGTLLISGEIWASIYWPKTLWHVDCRVQGSNHQIFTISSDLNSTISTSSCLTRHPAWTTSPSSPKS